MKKKDWKARTIRMSDELWFEAMKQAKIHGTSTAEFVRRMMEIELFIESEVK